MHIDIIAAPIYTAFIHAQPYPLRTRLPARSPFLELLSQFFCGVWLGPQAIIRLWRRLPSMGLVKIPRQVVPVLVFVYLPRVVLGSLDPDFLFICTRALDIGRSQ